MASFAANKIPGNGWAKPVFQLGRGKTLAIPMEVHAASRAKLVDLFRKKGVQNGVVLLEGGQQQYQYDSDTELLFRQDSWFNYLFGVKESETFGAINIATGKTTLFVPKLPEEYRIWCGEIHPPSHFQVSYAVDEVLYVDDMHQWLQDTLNAQGNDAKLHLMDGENTDSGLRCAPAKFAGHEHYVDNKLVDTSVLHFLLSTARVIKSEAEIEVMRYCAYVASNAHVEVMRSIRNCTFEYELEAKFLYEIYSKGGCRRCAYTSICACGPNSAVLHYGHAGAPNDRELKTTDIALLDMGAEYHGYVSDITCSYPVSGKFTTDQRVVYEAVLEGQRAVLALMRPGVAWTDCHAAAQRAILTALHAHNVIINGTIDEYVAAGIGAVFFPHGLGHLIGCDTHDVGGYIDGTPARSELPGLKKLRTARVLEVGMVLTNEPGCYFIDALIDQALADVSMSKYLNVEVLHRFRGFGGVRLEDVVVVTADGVENLTTCPRTVDEVESVLAGGQWPPAEDHAPELKRVWKKLAADGSMMV